MIRGPIVFTIAHLIEKANSLHQRLDNGSHPPDVETIIDIGKGNINGIFVNMKTIKCGRIHRAVFICGLSIGNRYVNPLMNELKDGGQHPVP